MADGAPLLPVRAETAGHAAIQRAAETGLHERRGPRGGTALLVGAVPTSAAAQPSKERPFIHAAKVDTGPKVDGVLDDAVWQTAIPVETFTQQEPNLGQPASERTEVRIVYDSRTICIAVHAYQLAA